MKKYLLSFAVLLMGMSLLTACSDDDKDDVVKYDTVIEPEVAYHYDLTVTTEKHGGMGRDKTHLTQSVASLSDTTQTIDFKNAGAEIADYTMESVYRGKYMYQVPVSSDRFVKLQFKDNVLSVVQAQPFVKNTYTCRNYTHAWLDDNTLLIMSTNGDNDKIIWTKLNTTDMSIIAEGELAISVAEGYNLFTTSGICAYRKSDNKVFYFYYNKQKKSGSNKTTNEPFFRIAVLDAATMAVEHEIVNKEAEQMQGSAYGELLQDIVFFDEQDNLYLSAFSAEDKTNIGRIIRIKKGEFDFEAGYNAFPGAKGKICSVQYLGNGKAFAYSGDGSGTSVDSYAYYYSIVDLNTKSVSRLQYKGVDLPVSGGSFSQRSALNSAEGKMYFGINAEDAQPCIYIYDVKTGSVTKGASVAEGYYFDQIRIVED